MDESNRLIHWIVKETWKSMILSKEKPQYWDQYYPIKYIFRKFLFKKMHSFWGRYGDFGLKYAKVSSKTFIAICCTYFIPKKYNLCSKQVQRNKILLLYCCKLLLYILDFFHTLSKIQKDGKAKDIPNFAFLKMMLTQ